MLNNPYRYVLDLFRADGSRAGHAAIHVDWDAAEESARFAALRRSGSQGRAARSGATAEPIWHPTLGAPYVSGVRLAVPAPDAEAVATEIPTTYFTAYAQQAAALLVERGSLESGTRIIFLATAFPADEPVALLPSSAAFTAVDAAPDLPLPVASRDEIEDGSTSLGIGDPDDVPVFMAASVLDEAAQLARNAGGQETGGVLVGHVHRDSGGADLFVRVTAQLPARHTEASATRLTFTSATWTDIRAALALRGRGELMLGWWHSHPVREWCRNCPPERQRVCALGRDFFSEHDQALHRTVFGAAYSVALVVNDGAGDPTFSLFGWRRGLIESRAFDVTGASHHTAASAARDTQLECEPCSQRETPLPTSAPLSAG